MDNDIQPTMTVDEDGDEVWLLNGEFHRTDGPAIKCTDGSSAWCLNGVGMSFDAWLNYNQTLTNKQKTLYRIQYSQLNTI
jgi:hypothetical protein